MAFLTRVFRFLGSARFAIALLLILSLALIYGTFLESAFGPRYAGIVVYRSWWFILLQGVLFLTLFIPVIQRLPFRRRLAGFYLIHTSITLILVGSLLTKKFGLDGSIEIIKGHVRYEVLTGQQQVRIKTDQQEYQVPLPSVVSPKRLEGKYDFKEMSISLLKYLPYAKLKREWVSTPQDDTSQGFWVGTWVLKNEITSSKFELSSVPLEGVENEIQIGPITLTVISNHFFSILEKNLAKKTRPYVLADLKTEKVWPISFLDNQQKISENGNQIILSESKDAKLGLRFVKLKIQNESLRFFPKYSEAPVNQHHIVNFDSRYRLYPLSDFQIGKRVFITRTTTGNFRFLFGSEKKWTTHSSNGSLSLPWMNFNLSLNDLKVNQKPVLNFVSVSPNRKEEKNTSALLVKMDTETESQEFWIASDGTQQKGHDLVSLTIEKKPVLLPFGMSLKDFKIGKVPGTDQAASYESETFIHRKRSTNTDEVVRIYMNNPYKSGGFTFYQSSYLQAPDGNYHSILSVNNDPGRIVKYIGSILLILSLSLHYFITQRKTG